MTKDDLKLDCIYTLSDTMTVQLIAINAQSFKVRDVNTGQIYFLDYSISLPRLKER